MNGRGRSGFSLIELLVVLFILGVLFALLLPAIQSARQASRRVRCMNNLKQLGLALHNYEASWGAFPPPLLLKAGLGRTPVAKGWSAHARLLPFHQQGNLFNSINFISSFESPSNQTVMVTEVATYSCPSDVDRPTLTGLSAFASNVDAAATNYAVCMGDWFVWGGFGENGSRSAFSPNQVRKLEAFTDGLSSTLMMSEVLRKQHQITECGGLLVGLNSDEVPGTDVRGPRREIVSDQSHCSPWDGGHSAWVAGGVDQTGFTTAKPPNSRLPTDSPPGQETDIIGVREWLGGPTYAAVLARSRHPDGVNGLLADGSVRFFNRTINPSVWRALGTMNSGEIVCVPGY